MTMMDPIADMLTRIRNAQMARHERVEIPSSSIKQNILNIMIKEGYVFSSEEKQNGTKNVFDILLKYDKFGDPVIHKIIRKSKPGLRKYIKYNEIKPVMGGNGVAVLSTSKGIMTDREARNQKIGGELICEIW